jgi:hypothetical protein
MTSILTNEEKSGIISQHIKNIEYSLYNLTLSLIEENAVSAPAADKIVSLNDQIEDLNAQKTALESELSSLA